MGCPDTRRDSPAVYLAVSLQDTILPRKTAVIVRVKCPPDTLVLALGRSFVDNRNHFSFPLFILFPVFYLFLPYTIYFYCLFLFRFLEKRLYFNYRYVKMYKNSIGYYARYEQSVKNT